MLMVLIYDENYIGYKALMRLIYTNPKLMDGPSYVH